MPAQDRSNRFANRCRATLGFERGQRRADQVSQVPLDLPVVLFDRHDWLSHSALATGCGMVRLRRTDQVTNQIASKSKGCMVYGYERIFPPRCEHLIGSGNLSGGP